MLSSLNSYKSVNNNITLLKLCKQKKLNWKTDVCIIHINVFIKLFLIRSSFSFLGN